MMTSVVRLAEVATTDTMTVAEVGGVATMTIIVGLLAMTIVSAALTGVVVMITAHVALIAMPHQVAMIVTAAVETIVVVETSSMAEMVDVRTTLPGIMILYRQEIIGIHTAGEELLTTAVMIGTPVDRFGSAKSAQVRSVLPDNSPNASSHEVKIIAVSV